MAHNSCLQCQKENLAGFQMWKLKTGKVFYTHLLFLTEAGYKKTLESQDRSFIRILNHAKVSQGHLQYDRLDGVDYQFDYAL